MALKDLLGNSEPMRALRALIAQAAPTDISVLIIGESGTGKELVARSIHELSARKNKPLQIINCGAIPQGIFESEVFGHERGSYTGANRQRLGYFEQANGGTLVLDEVGEMPLSAQVKLLRILEAGEFMRVGSSRTQKVDVRIIASTNVDLLEAVEKGEFRRDLYYRLKAVQISVPSLREHASDIPFIAEHFIKSFCERNKLEIPNLSDDAKQLLIDQYWTGNVRELRNVIETVLTLERGIKILTANEIRRHLPLISNPQLLPVHVNRPPEIMEKELMFHVLLELRKEVNEIKQMIRLAMSQVQNNIPQPSASIKLEDMERDQIIKSLEQNGGNRRKTAKSLGIAERTLYRKMKEHDIV